MIGTEFIKSLTPTSSSSTTTTTSSSSSSTSSTSSGTSTSTSSGGAETLLRQPVDDRALLAVLLLREGAKEHSPLLPYIQSFLQLPPGVPAGWDPSTDAGAARRAELQASNPRALVMADALRRLIAKKYDAIVPAAIEWTVSTNSSPLGSAHGGREELARTYSLARFRDVWLAIASRDFTNSLQATNPKPLDRGLPFPATFLVPLIDLMNHGGSNSNVAVSFDHTRRRGFVMTARRAIRRGEELRFNYGMLCAEKSLMMYGFADEEMETCPMPGGSR